MLVIAQRNKTVVRNLNNVSFLGVTPFEVPFGGYGKLDSSAFVGANGNKRPSWRGGGQQDSTFFELKADTPFLPVFGAAGSSAVVAPAKVATTVVLANFNTSLAAELGTMATGGATWGANLGESSGGVRLNKPTGASFISFAGSSASVVQTNEEITVEMKFWQPAGDLVGHYYNFGGNSIDVQHNGTNLIVQTNNVNHIVVNAAYQPVQNAWNHIAIERNSNLWMVYLNGVLVGSAAVTQNSPYGSSSSSMVFGNANVTSQTATTYFEGIIFDYIRITKGRAVYKGNFTPLQTVGDLTGTTSGQFGQLLGPADPTKFFIMDFESASVGSQELVDQGQSGLTFTRLQKTAGASDDGVIDDPTHGKVYKFNGNAYFQGSDKLNIYNRNHRMIVKYAPLPASVQQPLINAGDYPSSGQRAGWTFSLNQTASTYIQYFTVNAGATFTRIYVPGTNPGATVMEEVEIVRTGTSVQVTNLRTGQTATGTSNPGNEQTLIIGNNWVPGNSFTGYLKSIRIELL